MQNIEIYLGKGGQTFGPYTVEQFEAMKSQPDFESYTYIWDGRDEKPDWKPLEKAPPKPVAKKGPGAPPPDQQAQARVETPKAKKEEPLAEVIPITSKAPRAKLHYDAPTIEAICHDSHTIVSGRLSKITDGGCELLSTQTHTEQGFGSGSNVVLNLLDSETGKSMTVPARLSGFKLENGQWNYRVVWDECPSLIMMKIGHKLDKAA